MAYDEGTAERVRVVLAARAVTDELRMFGGLAFMLGGHMCCGIIKDELLLWLGPDQAAAALRQPHVRPMDFTGRPMTGYVIVAAAGLVDDEDLAGWVEQAIDFTTSLPPKAPKAARPRPRASSGKR